MDRAFEVQSEALRKDLIQDPLQLIRIRPCYQAVLDRNRAGILLRKQDGSSPEHRINTLLITAKLMKNRSPVDLHQVLRGILAGQTEMFDDCRFEPLIRRKFFIKSLLNLLDLFLSDQAVCLQIDLQPGLFLTYGDLRHPCMLQKAAQFLIVRRYRRERVKKSFRHSIPF